MAAYLLEVVPPFGWNEIATKTDLAAVEQRMGLRLATEIAGVRTEMAELRGDVRRGITELRGEITGLRGDVRGEITELRGDVRGEITELRGDVRGEITELRGDVSTDIADARGDLRADIGALATSVEAKLRSQTRWLAGLVIAAVGISATLARLA